MLYGLLLCAAYAAWCAPCWMILKHLNATEQPTACRPKWRHIVRSIAVASRAYAKLIFLETVFWLLM